MNEIQKYIQSYFGIGGQALTKVTDLFVETQVAKNEYLLKEGMHAPGLSFVKDGLIRMYALDAKGNKEVTQWISATGMFATDLSSLIFNAPSRYNIQALTDSTIYKISNEDYNQIGSLIPEWLELEKLFIAKCFVTLENRVFNQISMTAEEKYLELFEMNPDIFNQVPLQYIASMLGMTPETFSRIRKKLNS